MASNGIKLAAIYLYESRGCSMDYVAVKFNVNKSTVSRWVKDKQAIKNQNKDDLVDFLIELNYGQRLWRD